MKTDKKKMKQLAREEEKKHKKSRKTNREMAVVTYIVLVLFLVMIAYVAKFTLTDRDKVLNNQYNKRQELLAQWVTRGKVLSSDGKILAKTVKSNNAEAREYPYDGLFAHTVGRMANGKTGLELSYGYTMLTSDINPVYAMVNQMKGEKNPGNNVVTTMSVRLSQAASDALGSRKGAVVAMDPETGKILTMVSKPTYNPNTVSENWSSLTDDSAEESALYNRATQGLYPPGSTFKLYTALEYMREKIDYKKFSYKCLGEISKGPDSVHCYSGEVHGNVDLSEAVTHSCNCAFCKISESLSIAKWRDLCESFYFNSKLPIEVENKASQFTLKSNAAMATIWQTGIGQGDTLVSPMQNALLVAAVENGGKLMQPYLVDRVEDAYGKKVSTTSPSTLASPMSEKEAKALRKMMIQVVKSGTGRNLRYAGYTAGGKTGSAEYELKSSKSHAWFVGFAEKDGRKIVISVIVEGAGTGGTYAVPIAKRVFDAYFE